MQNLRIVNGWKWLKLAVQKGLENCWKSGKSQWKVREFWNGYWVQKHVIDAVEGFSHFLANKVNKVRNILFVIVFRSKSNILLDAIDKVRQTSQLSWLQIYLQSDKEILVTGQTVLLNLSPNVTVLAEYIEIPCFNQPKKSHIGKLRLAAINTLVFCFKTELSWIFSGHWSLNIILHSNLKHIFFLFYCLFSNGVCLVKSWLVRQIFPVHQTGCPVKSGKLS